jgi:hypothetical protein
MKISGRHAGAPNGRIFSPAARAVRLIISDVERVEDPCDPRIRGHRGGRVVHATGPGVQGRGSESDRAPAGYRLRRESPSNIRPRSIPWRRHRPSARPAPHSSRAAGNDRLPSPTRASNRARARGAPFRTSGFVPMPQSACTRRPADGPLPSVQVSEYFEATARPTPLIAYVGLRGVTQS